VKSELQQNLVKINAFLSYSPNLVSEYKALLVNCIALLRETDHDAQSPIYTAWAPMALEELERNVIKFDDSFLQLPLERQKTEFLYSKSAVTLTLQNIVMNL
jgi:hypothetical protein